MGELLVFHDFCLHKLIEGDKVQLWERSIMEHTEMAVLRYEIVGSDGKGAIYKFVTVGAYLL